MPDQPTFNQPNTQAHNVYNVAGNFNQGAPTAPAARPRSVLPYPTNNIFLGRDTQMANLAEWLAHPHAVVAISGLGGVGKTQLATEFAHECADNPAAWPGGVFWVPMSNAAGVATAVADSGRALGLAGYAAMSLPEQVEATRSAWAGPEQRLLVFDNCEDPALLKAWRPTTGGAHVLLTSRYATWPPAVARTLPLAELPRDAALELLLSGRAALLGIPAERLATDPTANTICEQLGDLALAIHMAAAYLAARASLSLAGFLAELRAQSIDHAALREIDQDSPTEHIQHIAQTIELSYRLLGDEEPEGENRRTEEPENQGLLATNELVTQNSKLKTQNSRAREILDLAAHCAPGAPIPLELLRRAIEDDGQTTNDDSATPTREAEDEGQTTEDERRTTNDDPNSQLLTPNSQLLDPAIYRLVTIGLASYGDAGQALSIHRLVAAYARKRQDAASAVELADQVADLLGWMTKEIDDKGFPAKMQPLLAHAQYVAAAADARGSEHAATLLNNIGTHFDSVAAYDQARALYERALHIDEANFGPDHPNVAIRVNNLGMVAKTQGDLPAARTFLERALRIDEAAFGPDHPNVARDVNNLGLVIKDQGDLTAARAFLERALRIDEASFGPDHPEVAIDVNNLGSVAQAQGDLTAARAYLERALRIDEASFGPDHPEVATDVNNLGSVAKAQGDLTAARAFYERALHIDEASFGPDHPNVARDVNNLGTLAKAQGDLPAARAFLERALRIKEQRLGADHPSTQLTRANLASLPAADT